MINNVRFLKPIISLRFIIFLLLISGIVNMQTHADTMEANKKDYYHTTRDYYNNLIVSNDLPVAELGMLVNILPKGGDIHHHFIGAIYVETFLDYIKKEGFYIDPNSQNLRYE